MLQTVILQFLTSSPQALGQNSLMRESPLANLERKIFKDDLNVLYCLSQKELREQPNIDSSRSTYVGEEPHIFPFSLGLMRGGNLSDPSMLWLARTALARSSMRPFAKPLISSSAPVY